MPSKTMFPAILVLVASATLCYGQRSINLHDHLLIRDSNRYLYGDPEFRYEGSPYLDNEFVMAHLYMGTEKFKGVPMRLNVYADVFEFKENGQTFLLQADPRIAKIEIGEHIFVVDNFKYMGKKENGFLELLEAGPLTLLAKKVVNYREEMPLQGVPAKFASLPDSYYYRINGASAEKITSVRNLIEQLPDHQEQVRKFVKIEKISTKDHEDLLKLVRFYNSLSSPH